MVFDNVTFQPVSTRGQHPMSELWSNRGAAIYVGLQASKAVLAYQMKIHGGGNAIDTLCNMDYSNATTVSRIEPDVFVSRPLTNKSLSKKTSYQLNNRDRMILDCFDFGLKPNYSSSTFHSRTAENNTQYTPERQNYHHHHRQQQQQSTYNYLNESSDPDVDTEFSRLASVDPINDTTFMSTPEHPNGRNSSRILHLNNKREKRTPTTSMNDLSSLQSLLLSESSVTPSHTNTSSLSFSSPDNTTATSTSQ